MAPVNILLVEDERIIALDIKMRLEQFGYTVIGVATSGEEALRIASEEHPNLILMDIHLDSAMTGVEAAQIIYEKDPVPIVFLTAYVDEDTLRQALASEPVGYLLKPFYNHELKDMVELVIEKYDIH